MDKDIYILGLGHNTPVIIDLAEDCGWNIRGLIHYNGELCGQMKWGYPVICDFEELFRNEDLMLHGNFALSMGDVRIRASLYNRIIELGGRVPSLIHPSAYVSRRCRIGHGVQIMQGCVVEASALIDDDTVVTVNTVVHHSTKIGKHNLISGNVVVGAYTSIGNQNLIGQSSTIVSGKVKSIGNNCILGAGAVLIRDLPDNSVAVGVPARIVRISTDDIKF